MSGKLVRRDSDSNRPEYALLLVDILELTLPLFVSYLFATVFAVGSPVLIYIILAIVIPRE